MRKDWLMDIFGYNMTHQNVRFLWFHSIESLTVSSSERESWAWCSRSSCCCCLIVLLLKIYNKGTGQDLSASEVVQNACSVYRRFGPRLCYFKSGSVARPMHGEQWTGWGVFWTLFSEEGLFVSERMSN